MSLDHVRPVKDKTQVHKELKLSPGPVVALLAGSRKKEVERILPVLLKATRFIHQSIPDVQFVISQAPSVDPKLYHQELEKPTLRTFVLIRNRTPEILAACDAAMVASGTATLEALLTRTPFVIIYKAAKTTAFFAKRLIRLPYIGMVNVLAGKLIVPEFLQEKADPEAIACEVIALLEDQKKRSVMLEQFEKVCPLLGEPGVSDRAAKIIHDFLSHREKETVETS